MSALRHFRAILLLPFMVTVVVPATILLLTGPDTFNLWQSYPTTRVGLPILGCAFICLGLVLLAATIRLYVTVGKAPRPRGTRPRSSWSRGFTASRNWSSSSALIT